jgi:hypothetical protein
MDKRLVEFCIALPGHMRLRDGWTRYIMRRAMEGIVPDSITWRVGKGRMSANFWHGLYNLDGALLEGLVTTSGLLDRYIHKPYLLGMYQRRKELSEEEATQLARIATLAFWLNKRFTDAFNYKTRNPFLDSTGEAANTEFSQEPYTVCIASKRRNAKFDTLHQTIGGTYEKHVSEPLSR